MSEQVLSRPTRAKGAGLLRRLLYSVKAQGLASTMRWAWFGCAGWHTFHVHVIETIGLPPSQPDEDFVLAIADAQLIKQVQQSTDFQTTEAYISETCKYSQCLLGLQGSEPAHIMWVFRQGDDSRFFDLDEHEAEINYCYTPVRFRRAGMYQKSLHAAIQHLRKQGIERIYMATHDTNEPSERAIAKADFTHVGDLRHFGILHRPKWKRPWSGDNSLMD